MINVEIKSVQVDTLIPDTVDFGKKDTPWLAWLMIHLWDIDQNREIPEWFYAAACSRQYLENEQLGKDNIDERKVIVQDNFSIEDASTIVRKKFAGLSFESWDEFYAKMTDAFFYDEDEDTVG